MTGLSSCSSDEPDDQGRRQRLILIYAVAANNLENNLTYDLNEILLAAKDGNLNLRDNTILVYSVDNTGKCMLRQIKKTSTNYYGYEFSPIASFPELPLSTSEERIADVIEYVDTHFSYAKKGLVLWSHSDGWLPWAPGGTPGEEKRKSFGVDNYEGSTYKTDINLLADAIPEDVFDFIWFDCCYMANIETVYQLREKTDYIVGSVLEIASDGMPYNLTMPYLLKANADLEGASEAFFKYYNDSYIPVSVSIMSTQELPLLADATSAVLKEGTPPTNLSGIQTYQRKLSVNFYDMGQLLRSYGNVPEDLTIQLDRAFEAVVTFKKISARDFNNRAINVAEYSGLSMHHFKSATDYNNEYYTTLDWYKATRE